MQGPNLHHHQWLPQVETSTRRRHVPSPQDLDLQPRGQVGSKSTPMFSCFKTQLLTSLWWVPDCLYTAARPQARGSCKLADIRKPLIVSAVRKQPHLETLEHARRVAPLVADPTPTDTNTDRIPYAISYGQPNFWLYGNSPLGLVVTS